jgi:hypothetical protein
MSNTSWSTIATNDSVYIISIYIYICLSLFCARYKRYLHKERERDTHTHTHTRERERERDSTTKLGCTSIMRRKTKREVGFSTTKLKNCCYELGEEKTGRKQHETVKEKRSTSLHT